MWRWLSRPQVTSDHDISATSGSPEGIKVLFEPKSVTVDIVFIHELTETRDTVWHSRGVLGVKEPGPLLETLLRGGTGMVGNARIVSFGYDGGGITTLGGLINPGRLEKCADLLLRSYPLRIRPGTAEGGFPVPIDRPAIFIAHGFGGLIYEQALTTTNVSGSDESWARKHAALLVDAPHHGAGIAEWAIITAKKLGISCAATPQSQNWSEHEARLHRIEDMQRMFRKIIREEITVDIVACYATKPTPESKINLASEWAVLPDFRPIALNYHHFEVAKLHSKDPGFQKVMNALEKWAKELPGVTEPQPQTPTRILTMWESLVSRWNPTANQLQHMQYQFTFGPSYSTASISSKWTAMRSLGFARVVPGARQAFFNIMEDSIRACELQFQELRALDDDSQTSRASWIPTYGELVVANESELHGRLVQQLSETIDKMISMVQQEEKRQAMKAPALSKYDESSQPIAPPKPLSNPRRWLSRLQELTAELAEDTRGHVRIAVLGTGCDRTVRFFSNRDSFRNFTDWVDFTSSFQNPWQDVDGVGTHLVSLIMEIAPKAEIGVARVAVSSDDKGESVIVNIIKAIRWAEEAFRADIIFLASGFGPSDLMTYEQIKSVLLDRRDDVLLFTPGSDDENSTEALPIIEDGFIAIRSTNAEGEFKNSSPMKPNVFGALGVEVPGAGIGSDIEVLRSGALVATAIAVGIAGALFGFVGDHPLTRPRARWGTTVLRAVAVVKPKQNGWYLDPCDRFASLRREARWSMVLQALREHH